MNGLGDALLALPQGQKLLLDGAYVPLMSSLGSEHFAVTHMKQVWGFMFLGLGAFRILAGLNYKEKLARQVAILSYLAEMVPAAFFIATTSSEHVNHSALIPMAVVPGLAIAIISQYKDEDGKKSK